MFMVFKPYDPIMAIPMEYYVVMYLHFGDILVHPHTLQKMFRRILQFSSKYDIFYFTVPELVSLWRMYIDYAAKCHHPKFSQKVRHVWCKIPSFMNSQAAKLSPIV
jgi:hypothetical protein